MVCFCVQSLSSSFPVFMDVRHNHRLVQPWHFLLFLGWEFFPDLIHNFTERKLEHLNTCYQENTIPRSNFYCLSLFDFFPSFENSSHHFSVNEHFMIHSNVGFILNVLVESLKCHLLDSFLSKFCSELFFGFHVGLLDNIFLQTK